MNYKRIFVSAIVATIAYFVVGGLVFAVMGPGEFSRYPAVFRTASDMQSHIPVGLIGTFLGILALTVIFARGCEGRRGIAEGAVFGILVGVFAVCAFVLHNFVNLNIGLKLTIEQAGGFLFEWILVGIIIGGLYKPRLPQALPSAGRP
jgi:hypothetical protein